MITSGAMYMGDPQSVAAMLPSARNLANPKSAILSIIWSGEGLFGSLGS